MNRYFRNHEKPEIWFAETKSTFLDSVCFPKGYGTEDYELDWDLEICDDGGG